MERNMDIKLTNLFIVFFQRTNYIDISAVVDFITKNIDEVKKCKENQFTAPPINLDTLPKVQLISESTPFYVTIFNNKIEFSATGIFEKNQYTEICTSFLAVSKTFSKLVASKENICGRIGIVNDSFIIEEKPADLILNSFIKDSTIQKPSTIYINYTNQEKMGNIDINIINTIQQGVLNTEPKRTGIIVHRDVNIKNMQSSIKSGEIEKFITFAGRKITEKEMAGILHG